MLSIAETRLLEQVRAFAAEQVAPNAAAWAAGTRDARELMSAAAALGLFGLQLPVSSGGLGLSFRCQCAVSAALAASDFGFALSVINSHNVALQLARCAAPRVAAALVPELLAGRRAAGTALTEPGAGSDFAAITMHAAPVSDGWRLDGRKTWIINAAFADVFVVHAQTAPGRGAPGIAAFVVDATRPGFVREARADIDLRSTAVGGFVLQGWQGAPDALLIAPGQAFKAALESINAARVYVAAMCCAMAEAGLRLARAHGITRRTFGAPLQAHQGWRWQLAEAALQLDAARALVDHAVAAIDAGRPAQAEAARAKLFATRMALQQLAALQHAMGADGLHRAHPLSRHLAAAQAATLIDGSSEMLLERIAKDLFREPRARDTPPFL